jgi:delta24(24(1))-sterol reductase
MIETPARRNTRRKTAFPTESDAESTSASEAMESRSLRHRGAPKFTEHIEESAPSDSDANPSPKVASPKVASPKANGKTDDGEKVIDGWKPGMDPKVDLSGEYEFGGPWFVALMMIGFPVLMWYMWIGATYYDGGFPTPAAGQSLGDFAKHHANLVYTGAFPHAKAWAIYWIFFIVEGAFYCLMPGVWAYGKPLRHEGGKQLKYYCSGYTSFYSTIAIVAGLHFSGVFPLYTIIDEFGPLLSVSILTGWLVAIVAYISALARGAQHRMSGNHVYDFFMGAELNPRMFGILDFKMFFEVRMPWYILFLLSCGAAARQWERYGYVSGEVGFLVMAHFLYGNATAKGEELIVTTWDMYYEKWGFMLIFWNLSGVPLSYCHCTIYLANHAPEEYRWNRYALAALYVSYLFVYWVWDSCNSQKNRFRAMERGKLIKRNTFPQLPWQTLHNPKTIDAGVGDKILADGWYGLARKVHYTCDVYFATTWGLITGFNSPFPWFYPVFFVTMIAHRAWRDISRCREKYGEAWMEYERQVPYLFIPVSFGSFAMSVCGWLADFVGSTSFKLSRSAAERDLCNVWLVCNLGFMPRQARECRRDVRGFWIVERVECMRWDGMDAM